MILHQGISKAISSIKGEDFILDNRIPIGYLFSTIFFRVFRGIRGAVIFKSFKGYLSLHHPKSNVFQRFK